MPSRAAASPAALAQSYVSGNPSFAQLYAKAFLFLHFRRRPHFRPVRAATVFSSTDPGGTIRRNRGGPVSRNWSE